MLELKPVELEHLRWRRFNLLFNISIAIKFKTEVTSDIFLASLEQKAITKIWTDSINIIVYF